ncbi:MAG: hypothetical protein Q7T71_21080 [Herbiconiux sp.]|nr:hypothetical protein [Herbiconiux sp.]
MPSRNPPHPEPRRPMRQAPDPSDGGAAPGRAARLGPLDSPPGPDRAARPGRRRSPAAGLLAAAAGLALVLTGCTPGSPAVDGAADSDRPSATAEAAVTPTVTAPQIPTGAPAVLAFPETGAGAVGLAHPDGTVQPLGQGGTTDTVPIASITKVITSLVVLDAHPLAGAADPGPTLTLAQPDLDTTARIEAEGQFTEPMFAGQQVTLHDALAVTLLTSANNYAESVAAWAFGSPDAYLEAARAWLAEQGLTGTTLADASGLDPGSASTTADLLRVAALAHANPALAAITALASYDQPDLGTIANQNILLGEEGVDGLKTGSTSYAGFTLLTSAVVPVGGSSVTLVAVVLGTESLDARFATTRALLASARAGLAEVQLAAAGQEFAVYDGSPTGTATSPTDTATSPTGTATSTPDTATSLPDAATSPTGTATSPSGSATSTPDAAEAAPGAAASPETLTHRAVAAAPVTAVVFGDTPVTTAVTLPPLSPAALADAASGGSEVGTATVTAGTSTWTIPLVISP